MVSTKLANDMLTGLLKVPIKSQIRNKPAVKRKENLKRVKC